MGVRKSLLRLVLGPERSERLNARRTTRRIMRSPDRQALLGAYLPAFAAEGGRMLWVGCRDYTEDYPQLLERGGGEAWTTDIDPLAERWGRAGRHRTGDLRQLDRLFEDVGFDAILCNGVLGWGVDEAEDQSRALAAMAGRLRPGGRLLLGWNTDRIEDPLAAGLTAPWYEPGPFAGIETRARFPGATHVYDLLVRR